MNNTPRKRKGNGGFQTIPIFPHRVAVTREAWTKQFYYTYCWQGLSPGRGKRGGGKRRCRACLASREKGGGGDRRTVCPLTAIYRVRDNILAERSIDFPFLPFFPFFPSNLFFFFFYTIRRVCDRKMIISTRTIRWLLFGSREGVGKVS